MGFTGSTGSQGFTGAQGPQGATGPVGNYPGTTFRDLVTFSFTQNSGVAGVPVPTATNILVFFQPASLAIAYIGFVYAGAATSGSGVSAVLGLIDMTGISYDNTTGGVPIGPAITTVGNNPPILSGGIFGVITVGVAGSFTTTSKNCVFQERNANILTPAGPYVVTTPGVGRPVGVRLYTDNNNRLQALSVIIGFTAA